MYVCMHTLHVHVYQSDLGLLFGDEVTGSWQPLKNLKRRLATRKIKAWSERAETFSASPQPQRRER